MRLTSKHRQRKRPRENRTCTGTLTNSTAWRFPHFLITLPILIIMHYQLINNIL